MPIYEVGDRKPTLPEPDADGENFWVAPNAFVLGDVTLKKNASIWFGATVRGDNESIVIGENSNVQENAVLHVDPGAPLVIGDNVTVGHLAMLHGCTIGDGSLIGIGAVVLNHTKIGRNCLIGAGAVVGENKDIPNNSVVLGIPGKVVRQMDDEEARGVSRGIEGYVKRWRRYAREMKPHTRGA